MGFQIDSSTDFGARVERRLREEEEIIWLVTVNADGTPEPGSSIVVFTGDAQVEDDAPPSRAKLECAARYRAGFTRIGITAEQFSYAYPLAIRIRPQRLRGY